MRTDPDGFTTDYADQENKHPNPDYLQEKTEGTEEIAHETHQTREKNFRNRNPRFLL
jgi:hypothetical protein